MNVVISLVKFFFFLKEKCIDEPLQNLINESNMKKRTLKKKLKELEELKNDVFENAHNFPIKELELMRERMRKIEKKLNDAKHVHIRTIQKQAKHDVDVKQQRVLP